MTKCSYASPSSRSTAGVTSPSAATGTVFSAGSPTPDGETSRSSRAFFTVTAPRADRRSSRSTTYRDPATSKTSRTRPRLTLGASAQPTARRSSQRGTDPYRAKTMASMTVDLPAPVGPTSAK